MRDKMLIFGAPYLDQEMEDEVLKCLHSGWWSTGPKVTEFEEEIKKLTNAKHCIAVNSCTAGLHLALLAANIGPCDEVITSPITWTSTANVIIHAGAEPIFADVDPNTGNLDPNSVATMITPRTRAIIVVHLAGHPCPMDEFTTLASKHNLTLIEDAAHALGTYYNNKSIGTIGDIGVYSFHATKNIATGEGGAIVTNNDENAEYIRRLAHCGVNKHAWERQVRQDEWQVISPGYKYNMMDIQAALGLPQLRKFKDIHNHRGNLWDTYHNKLSQLPVGRPMLTQSHSYHLYQISINNRDRIKKALYEQNIGTGVHFKPLHLEPFYRHLREQSLPHAENFGKRTLSLPLTRTMNENDINDVVSALIVALS
jgi:dTDP-4-amino-4,6-dideoxygalactose transaminase